MPLTENIKAKIANQKAVTGLDGVRMIDAVVKENNELKTRVKTLETTGGKPVRPRRFNRGM